MNTNVNENQVILTILMIFTISYSIHTYIMYKEKKADIHYVTSEIKQKIDNLYDEISNTMLQTQLKKRTKFILEKQKKEEKLQAFKDKNKDKLQKLFQLHYNTLKEQINGFNIMHFYDRDGISILRMHNSEKYGDDLKIIRSHVASVVQNPRTYSFYEVGIQGLAYRNITPVYFKNELIGFFEIGIRPKTLLQKIKRVFGLNSYFFVKNEYIPKNIDKNLYALKTDGYTLCHLFLKQDKFITENIKNLNFNKKMKQKLQHNGKLYSIISKDIYDINNKTFAQLILFQDNTLLQKQLQRLLINSLIIYVVSMILIYFLLKKYISAIFYKLNRARYLLDNTNDAVYVIRLRDALIVDVNERASLMMGYKKNELLSKSIFEIRESMPKDEPLNWEEYTRDLKLKHFLTSRGIHIRKNGSKFPIEANLSYIQNGDEYMIAVVRDITNQLEMEQKISKKAQELERLQKVISKAVLYTTSDLDGKITSVSKAFEELSGYKESELVGKNHSLFRNPNTAKEFYTSMWETLDKDEQFIGEIKNYTKEKGEYWIKITIDPLFDEDGKKIGYSSYRENITDKKELEYISIHDTLTNIYNRGYFQTELHKKINSAKRYNQNFSFAMLDIDHFKAVNDTYGHQVGDKVLQIISNCIKRYIREDDIFARWGGEEFVIIANGSDIKQLKLLIQKLQKEIAKVSFSPVPKVTVSFGLTTYQDGDNEESIQKRADDALYIAKNNGRDRYELL